jgi:xanthine dehydrogenase accessory factor
VVDIYRLIEDHLESGKEGTLATIIKRVGATLQNLGAKIFIDGKGAIHGTVGGGCVEAAVWHEARTIAGGNATKVVHYAMTGTEMTDDGMICGG